MTKRLSHNLDFQVSYTWSKSLTIGAEDDNNYFNVAGSAGGGFGPQINDVFNRTIDKTLSGYDQPQLLVVAGNYTTPKLTGRAVLGNTFLSWIARDWRIGAVLRYGSGMPIKVPNATSGLGAYTFQTSYADRVSGVPLLLQNLNCNCFDPNTTFVLNPAAWANPPAGQYGTSAGYYSDYRYQRRPVENASIGRIFPLREGRMSFQIRAEFTNMFNRVELNDPTSTNAFATQTRSAAGQATAGFGYINTGSLFLPPRQGQLVARFQF